MMKKYVFKPYSKIFPKLFDGEKKRISSRIKIKAVIEHVGSTSIPNLGGKGIIDIAIAAEQKRFDSILKILQKLGYEFRPTHSTPDRLFFRADLPDPEEEVRRYHLHLTHPESKDWKDLIGFRDYLRAHPKEAKKYAALKKKAAVKANEDGEKYRKLKGPLLERILTTIEKQRV